MSTARTGELFFQIVHLLYEENLVQTAHRYVTYLTFPLVLIFVDFSLILVSYLKTWKFLVT